MAYLNRTIIVPVVDVDAARTSVAEIPGCSNMFQGSLTTDPSGSPDLITHRFESGSIPEEAVAMMWPSSAVIGDLDAETWQQTAANAGLYPIVWGD